MANGRCRSHGGLTPRGLASANFKHGRHSKSLPARLADRYDEALNDPDLLELASEIRLADAFIGERLATLESGESGAVWRDLGRAWRSFATARASGDTHSMMDALSAIEPLITSGGADYGAQQEILDMVDRRRKLVEAEAKRRVQMQQMITAEQAMVLISAIADVVMRHVPDPTTRASIGRDLETLIAKGV
jgi:hypothetical protein